MMRKTRKKIAETGKKATSAEMQIRLATLYEMIVKGCSRDYIIRFCAEKYNIGERQVDVYLAKVKDKIENTFDDAYKKHILKKHLAQLEDLYVKNYIIEDFRECRNIIETKSKLFGHLGTKIVVEVEKDPFAGMSDKEIDAMIKAMEEEEDL